MWLNTTFYSVKRLHTDNGVMIEYLDDATWTRAKGNDVTISYTIVVSVSISCGRHLSLTFSLYTMTCLPHGL